MLEELELPFGFDALRHDAQLENAGHFEDVVNNSLHLPLEASGLGFFCLSMDSHGVHAGSAFDSEQSSQA